MDIKRLLTPVIKERLFKRKAILLIGPRQVGKTTLYDKMAKSLKGGVMRLNCDDGETRMLLTNPSQQELRLLAGNNKYLIIDEAQRVDEIGLTLKRMVEQLPEVQVLVTGSSSFELRRKINEPLTGRKFEYNLFPISTGELIETYGLAQARELLNFRLVYGSYPEILTHPKDAVARLLEITNSYLYKDILAEEHIRRPVLLNKILVALAFQLGSEVKYSEVAQTVGSDPKTVEKYIDLLEKCFVIFRMPALSRNLRNELKKSKKIYFYDNGIRNAIINNFAPPELRNDIGGLWENFFVSERLKYNHYRGYVTRTFFWRTSSQQEIDIVEEKDGKMELFEIKWNPAEKVKFPASFLESYPVSESHAVSPQNYLDFLV